MNSVNNRVDLEPSINGAAPVTETFFFDVVKDNGKVDVPLGFTDGDRIDIWRIDAYDPNGDRFATLGLRIANP